MNRERLEKAIETLINVEKQKLPFHMSSWYDNNECGEAACALGYISLQEWANKAGLTLTHKRALSAPSNGPIHEYNVPIFQDEGGYIYKDFYAGGKFFDISLMLSHWLFDTESYPLKDGDDRSIPITLGQVISRMQFLLGRYNRPERAIIRAYNRANI